MNFHYLLELFYQLNPEQTEVLYNEAVKALDVNKEDHLIDAYCGVGTIGFAFAKKVKTLRGMDIIPEAIEDAKRNAKRMGFDNTHYEAGTAEEIIPRWYKEGYRADALIVDPPRTGLDDKLLDTILTYVPEKMVYISCNVSTLARDLVRLVEVYDLHYIQSVDMFPHTARTEAVVKLIKKSLKKVVDKSEKACIIVRVENNNSGPLVKGLRHRLFTAVTRVRIPYGLWCIVVEALDEKS